MPVVNGQTWEHFRAAIGDILYMYHEMVCGSGGFFHATGVRAFDPLEMHSASFEDRWGDPWDRELLKTGCAVAVLAQLADYWDEGDPALVAGYSYFGEVRAAMADGTWPEQADLREALQDALAHDPDRVMMHRIYTTYVTGYFRTLANTAR